MTANDELAVVLNDHAVDDAAIGRTAAKNAPRDQWSLKRNGKTYRMIPERGRVEFRTASEGYAINRPDPTSSIRWFDLRGLPIERGVNRLAVTLSRSDPQVEESIVIDEVEIWVQP